jgi:hypothetical protein
MLVAVADAKFLTVLLRRFDYKRTDSRACNAHIGTALTMKAKRICTTPNSVSERILNAFSTHLRYWPPGTRILGPETGAPKAANGAQSPLTETGM